MKKTSKPRAKIERKKKKTKHDSIFVTEQYEPENFDEVIELHDFDGFIQRKDHAAERVLTDACLWPHLNKNLPRLFAAIETSREAADNSKEYFSACVIWWVCNLRDAIKKNDARAAADAAYRVAHYVNMALLAKIELAIAIGVKVEASGENKTNAKRRSDAVEQARLLADKVNRKMAANPSETMASIARIQSPFKPDTQRKRISRALKRAQKERHTPGMS